MSNSVHSRVVQHLRISAELLKRAQQRETEKQAQDAAAAEKIPAIVAGLKAIDYILPEQESKVAAALANPVSALELLSNFVQRRASEQSTTLGHGVKAAGAVDPMTTSRRGPIDAPVTNFDDTPAGQEFRRAILGA